MIAEKITQEILIDLQGRSGFDAWWHELDAETQQEIRETMEKIVSSRVRDIMDAIL